MRCKVKSNSMGYNGHIYHEGDYVDVISSGEVNRLLGYGVITVSPLPVAVKPDVEPIKEKKIIETITKKKGGKKK